jgi:serine/threonine protein kinase/Tfp pilus assembly protein PilF
MDSARWHQIQNLFHNAADLPQAEQKALLDTACNGDKKLIAEVLAMLDQDARGHSLLDRNLGQVALETLAKAVPASLVPKEFGPYRILKLLGEGGMGVVYLAERKDLSTQVAVKVLRDAWLSPARRERFASEQRTLAQLNHPLIARIYDADTLDDGTPWFVMEYVDGIPITQFCREHACSVEQRLHLFRSMCEAVQHAHGNAVIHRDLKPSNILVKRDGSVRLLDFGIAKQLESLDLPVDQTMTGLRLMTPAYASPEQVRGDQVGISTDVYSLGVILYELLTGQLPFDLSGLTPAEAATIITEHWPGKPSAAVKRIIESRTNDSRTSNPHTSGSEANAHALSLSRTAWADLDVLCFSAMHKDPLRRYRSVEALIRDVDRYLNGEPLEARPDAWQYRIGKFVRRNRRAVAATAVIFAIIIGLVAFFTVRLAKARDTALAEAARTERIQQFMANLFQGGDAAAGPSDSLRVVTIVDRGVQQAKTLNSDPKVQAELYENLGDIYQKLGKFEQADSLLNSALNQRKSLFGADSPEVAESLTALGLLRSDQARLEDAQQLVGQGLEMAKRHLPPNHPAIARATLAFGQVLAQRGSYDQAIPTLNEAVRLQSAPGVAPADLATSLSALADAHYSAGHYDACKSLYARVLQMHRQIYGERHPLVADDLGSIAAAQKDLGYYSEAESLERQALDIAQSYYGNDHPKTAGFLTSLGESLIYQKKFDEGIAALTQALAIQEHVYGPMHPAVAESLNELGNVASMRDQYDEARMRFQRAADIYRSVYGDHHYLVAIALSNVADTYLHEKDYPRAEQLFRDVVRRFRETLGPDNVNLGIAHLKLGRTLLRESRYKDAEAETLTGYEILIKQSSPSTSFIHAARTDLVADYEALNQPEKAAKFRAELANAEANPPNTAR